MNISWAAATPVKNEIDSKNLTCVFAKQILLNGDIGERSYSNPTLGNYGENVTLPMISCNVNSILLNCFESFKYMVAFISFLNIES